MYLCRRNGYKDNRDNTMTRTMNIVFDFGGVLMRHNRAGCLQALREIMPEERIVHVLGFGTERRDTLRHRFETGQCNTQTFLNQVLACCHPGTTEQQVIDAWNTMHAGIEDKTWAQMEKLHNKGHRLYLMSNTDDIHWQHTLALYRDRIETLFEKVFLSFEEKTVKPDEAFFKAVNQRIEPNAVPTLFVDDMEANRLAAEHFAGWKTYASVDELIQTEKLI